jgi:hypothetical protein
MKKRYITILVLGLVLLGTGFYFLLENHHREISLEENPIITANARYDFGGKSFTLYIYENRHVIYIKEINLRLDLPGLQPTRIWEKGNIQQEEMDSLLFLFNTKEFKGLDERNKFVGLRLENGQLGFSDMYYTLTIKYRDINRTVQADRYLPSTKYEEAYPDMPYPLNEIYVILKQVTDNRTTEVYRELIKN